MPRRETGAEREAQIAWEAEGIAEAQTDVTSGRVVDMTKVKAWIDSLCADNSLPVPYSGR